MNAEEQIAHLQRQVESLTTQVAAMAAQFGEMSAAMEELCTAASQAAHTAAPRAFRLERNYLGSKMIVTESGIRVEADPIVLVKDPDAASIPAEFVTSAARLSPETAAISSSGAEADPAAAVTAHSDAAFTAVECTSPQSTPTA